MCSSDLALIGRHVAKPSVYYDPTGTLDGFESWSNGLPILTSRADLRDWLARHLGAAGGSIAADEARGLIASEVQ